MGEIQDPVFWKTAGLGSTTLAKRLLFLPSKLSKQPSPSVRCFTKSKKKGGKEMGGKKVHTQKCKQVPHRPPFLRRTIGYIIHDSSQIIRTCLPNLIWKLLCKPSQKPASPGTCFTYHRLQAQGWSFQWNLHLHTSSTAIIWLRLRKTPRHEKLKLNVQLLPPT